MRPRRTEATACGKESSRAEAAGVERRRAEEIGGNKKAPARGDGGSSRFARSHSRSVHPLCPRYIHAPGRIVPEKMRPGGISVPAANARRRERRGCKARRPDPPRAGGRERGGRPGCQRPARVGVWRGEIRRRSADRESPRLRDPSSRRSRPAIRVAAREKHPVRSTRRRDRGRGQHRRFRARRRLRGA